jgi:uncharacterized protein (DUF58 family)
MTVAPLHWRPTHTLYGLASVGLVGLLLAVVLREGFVVALVAPELLWLAYFSGRALPPSLEVQLGTSVQRCEELEIVDVTLTVHAPASMRVEAWCNGSGSEQAGLRSGEVRSFTWSGQAGLWGRRPLRRGRLVLTSPGGLWDAATPLSWPEVTVAPSAPRLRRAAGPARLTSAAGAHAARTSAWGGEAIGAAPYAPGVPIRRVHWRQTMRHHSLHLTTYAADRAGDVVVVVDAIVEAGPPGDTTVDRAVRAAASLARTSARDGDRTGLVTVTPALAWVAPGLGRRHLVRLMDVLTGLRDRTSLLPPDLARIPPSVVPTGCRVVVLSPLLHEHSIALVADLRRSGHEVMLVDILHVAPPATGDRRFVDVAQRLWRLDRAATTLALRDRGVTVMGWPAETSLDVLFGPSHPTPSGALTAGAAP